jgi:hypothetical protein
VTDLLDRLIDFAIRYVRVLPPEFQGVVVLPCGLDDVRYVIVA